MSLKLTDITQWNVSAVVLVLMLFTKWLPVRVLIAENFNYFMTSLRGKIEVKVKLENSMKTKLECHPSSLTSQWGVSAVVLVVMLFTKWSPWNNQNVPDRQTDGNRQSNSWLHATRPKINLGYLGSNQQSDWVNLVILFPIFICMSKQSIKEFLSYYENMGSVLESSSYIIEQKQVHKSYRDKPMSEDKI